MALRHLVPKHPRILLASVGAALLVLAASAGLRWREPWSPGRPAGLVFGSVAAAIVLVDGLYPLRRRIGGRRPMAAAAWLQFHVYGGSLAGLLALLHFGPTWPSGRMGWLLLLTGGWTVASGILGVVLQKLLPATLATELTVEATYERLPALAARLQGEADRIMGGATEMLDRVYQAEVRPALAALHPSWTYLVEIQTTKLKRLAPLHDLEAFVSEADRPRLADLTSIVNEKLQLDVQFTLQRVLRHWQVLHVPAASLFMAVLLLHIVAVLAY